jgi:hypothetical protein
MHRDISSAKKVFPTPESAKMMLTDYSRIMPSMISTGFGKAVFSNLARDRSGHPHHPSILWAPQLEDGHALYQRVIIMTHRDGLSELSVRSQYRRDVGHHKMLSEGVSKP